HSFDWLRRRAAAINRRIDVTAKIGRPVPFVSGVGAVYASDPDDAVIPVEHRRVVAGRALPLIKSANRVVVTGGEVFASARVVVIAECGHSRERIASQAVSVAEVIFRRHIAAHPFGGASERSRELGLAQSVLAAVIIDQSNHRLLLGVNRLSLGPNTNRDHNYE